MIIKQNTLKPVAYRKAKVKRGPKTDDVVTQQESNADEAKLRTSVNSLHQESITKPSGRSHCKAIMPIFLAESGIEEARSVYGQTTATSGVFEAIFGFKMEKNRRNKSGFKLKKMTR